MFYDYLTLIGHAALMTLGLAICSLIVGLLLSIIFTALESNKYVFIAKPDVYKRQGHNDSLVGLIIAKGQELCDCIAYIQNGAGAVLSPFDSWLTVRGMKTLSLRMKRHQDNAKEIAEFLREQPQIDSVLYPNKGGMLSFRLKDENWVNTFLKSIKLITFAESLGGTESFITYPATQTHMDIPEAERVARGITNTLLRFSVGLEDVEDIKADLLQAFAQLK